METPAPKLRYGQMQARDGLKICRQCLQQRPVAEFSMDRSRADKLCVACKTCTAATLKAWHEANPETKREYYKRGYAKNKTKMLARSQDYRRRRTAEIVEQFKSRPCMDCGQSHPSFVMDFDHRPGEQKLFNLSGNRLTNRAFATVVAEIAKCDLVCANCHRYRTAKRLKGC